MIKELCTDQGGDQGGGNVVLFHVGQQHVILDDANEKLPHVKSYARA